MDRPGLTVSLVLANLMVYALTSILGGNLLQTNQTLLIIFGQANFLVLGEGWWWQLITSMFVHVNLPHLMGNMLFLFIFGKGAEASFTTSEYLSIYFGSGIFGGLLSLLMGPYSISAGASGAIFGLFGAVTIYSERLSSRSVMGALFYSMYFFSINLGANVNLLAHFGGLVVGLVGGYLLAKQHR